MLHNSLVLGTEVFSGNWGKPFSEVVAEEILLHAYKNELKELDSAPSYGELSMVEKLIGKIIKKNSLKFKIASKFKINRDANTSINQILKEVREQLDNSLKNLNTDCLSIYYFHSGSDDNFFIDEVWSYLNKRKKLGDIEKLGLSIKHELVINDKLKQLYHAKNYGISTVQTVLNLYSDQSLKKVIPYCQENDIEIYGRMPFAKGLLTGEYQNKESFIKNDPRAGSVLSENIIKFKLRNNNLSLEKVIKWPLKNAKKIVFSVKNIKQLAEIVNIS